MAEKKFSMNDAVSYGWKTMKENIGFFIGLMFVALPIFMVPGILQEVFKESIPGLSGLIAIISRL